MTLVRARVNLRGSKGSYSGNVLVDSGARMSILDSDLTDEIGVEYTGRDLSFVLLSGQRASEAIVRELDVEGEVLMYEVVAVARIPDVVREVLRGNRLDEHFILGILTLERADMVPDTTRGVLKRVESFIFLE